MADALPPTFVALPPRALCMRAASAATAARRAALQRDAALLLTRPERPIAGCDEAGAGALAGPLVAAAVMFESRSHRAPQPLLPLLDDSKRLSPSQRRRAFHHICHHPSLSVAHCVVAPALIDRQNVLNARLAAMRDAVLLLPETPQLLFVDGHLTLPRLSCPQRAVVAGDSLVSLVAAASIVAKVLRDDIMRQYAHQYPQYAFERNVGYPTKHHLLALRKHGPCSIHRRSFKPVRDAAAL